MRSPRQRLLFLFALAGVADPAVAVNSPMAQLLVFERIDHVAAGVNGIGAPGSAGGGVGTLELDGVSGAVHLALLYWHGIDIDYPSYGFTGGDADYDEADITFDGIDITGVRVAEQGSNNGWPGANPQPDSASLYRADVTSHVQLRGNGSYPVADLADGSDGHSANGATLIVYFDDGDPANDVRVVHYEGLQSNEGAQWAFPFVVGYQGGRVDAIFHVADGQSVLPDGTTRFVVEPGVSGASGTTLISYGTNHHDGLPLWGGLSVPGMGFERSSGARLWDIRRLHLVSLFGPPGNYALTTSLSSSTDLLTLLVAQIEQPADPQPTMISPNPFHFGDVIEDTISPPHRFVFRNLLSHSILVRESPSTNSPRYQVVAQTCEDQVLAPDATCTVDVVCAPTTVGHHPPSALEVDWEPQAGDIPADRSSYAQLHCSGVPDGPFSRLDGVPSSCDFGDQPAGTTSASTRILATNTGNLPLTVTEVVIFPLSSRPRFPIAEESCTNQVLQPGQACTIAVGFDLLPNQENQTLEGELVVRFTASDDELDSTEIPLTGTGIGAQGDTAFSNGFDWLACGGA